MPGGRPTLYRPEMPDEALQYARGGYLEHNHTLPTIEGLAEVFEVTVSTVKNWGNDEDKPEFLAALEILKGNQKRDLMERALVGDYNSTIAKLILSANHGMIERTAKEHSGPDGGAIPLQAIERTIVDPANPDS